MRGLYESILDDEADILTRSDQDANLILWSEIANGGMFDKAKFRIKPGSADGKIKLEYLGGEQDILTIKFLSEKLYEQFNEVCEGIYIYARNTIEMMIGFDFDFDTLPHFYDLEGDGYDDPFRIGATHINLNSQSCTLRNLNPENLGVNKKTTASTSLEIFSSAGHADVIFKDFRWDVPYANVIFKDIHIKNTKHIELSVYKITSNNVDVDNTADDEMKKIGILSHVRGNRDTIDQISFNNGVLKLADTTTSYTVRGSLSGLGIKTIIGDGSILHNVLANDVHLVSSMKRLGVVPLDSKPLTFDTYRSKPKIQIYNLQRVLGKVPPKMNFRAWCDITNDKKDWKEWNEVSSLNFMFYVGRGELNQVYSNCRLVRFADASSQISADIVKILLKHRYISDDELKTVFPLDNFTNLEYIAWNSGKENKCIIKTPKGWHLK